MFKDTLRAQNVVFLTDSHSKVWYLSFICKLEIFQATLAQGAVYLLFLRISKRQHKSCAYKRLTETSYLLNKLTEKPRILT